MNLKEKYYKKFCNYELRPNIDLPYATPKRIWDWLEQQFRREPSLEKLVRDFLPDVARREQSERVSGDKGEARATLPARVASERSDQVIPKIEMLVDKFLQWQLPKSVCSDPCVIMADYQFQRLGTNLLTADEARQMFEYLFSE